MKKQMKWFLGTFGVLGVGAILAGSVISCTTSNNNTSNDTGTKASSPTAYNNLGNPIKASNDTAWTVVSATSYFTKIWNGLTTTEQNTELKNAMTNSILYFEQLFNSTSYNDSSKYPSSISVELSDGSDANAKMSYDTTFTFSNIDIISPSDVNFTMMLKTSASASINGTTYNNFFSTTAELDYKDASFVPGVAKAGVTINGVASDDYYAQLVINNFDSVIYTQTPSSTSSLSNPTDLLAKALLSKGWGATTTSYKFADTPSSALPHFIYVGTYEGQTGINFGPISSKD